MRRAFTLIELMVVVAMIAILIASVGTSVVGAQKRARIEKATAEVKEMTNAILAYENFARGRKYELPTLNKAEAGEDTVGFILGHSSGNDSAQDIPVLFNASLNGNGKILDPWGHPYIVTIESGTINTPSSWSYQSGYALPNFNRLTIEERNQ